MEDQWDEWYEKAWGCLLENTNPTKVLLLSFTRPQQAFSSVDDLTVGVIRDVLFRIFNMPDSRDHKDLMVSIFEKSPVDDDGAGSELQQIKNNKKTKNKRNRGGIAP